MIPFNVIKNVFIHHDLNHSDTDQTDSLDKEKTLKYPKPEQQIHRYKVRANEGVRRRRLKSPTTEFKSLFNQDSFNNTSSNNGGLSVKLKLHENTKTSNNDWVGVGRPRRIITLSSDDDHKYPLPSPDQTTSWNDGVNIWSPPSTAPSTAGHTSFGNLAFN